MRFGGAHRRIFCRPIPTVKVRGKEVDQGNGVAEMTAVISRERAKATCLTGAAGVLMLAGAFVMMVLAAPGHVQGRPHDPARPPALQLTTDVGHQFTSRSDSARIRARRAGPAADSAWAEAYLPAIISESWSAGVPRSIRPLEPGRELSRAVRCGFATGLQRFPGLLGLVLPGLALDVDGAPEG
jgi:hypothetical protein